MADTQTTPPAVNGADSKPEEQLQPERIFIGGLDRTVKKAVIRESFGKIGQVKNVQLVNKRFGKGFAFVTYESADQAQAAIKEFDGSEVFEGTTLTVSLARAQAERKPRIDDDNQEDKPKKARKAKKPRKQEGEQPNTNGHVNGDAPEPAPQQTTDESAPQSTEEKPKKQAKPVKPRQKRERKGPPAGEPSKTTVFVGNLPTRFEEDELRKLFTDENLTVETAKIVFFRYGRLAGKSRGLAFVTFPNEQEQQKALKAFEDKTITFGEGYERKLSVRVAVEPDEEQEKEKENGVTESKGTQTAPEDDSVDVIVAS